MNNHIGKLKEDKLQLFKLIYNLKLIKLKILKIYIKTNLINSFVWPFKFCTRVLILFNQKLDNNFYIYINY